jgi:hypothetical protein
MAAKGCRLQACNTEVCSEQVQLYGSSPTFYLKALPFELSLDVEVFLFEIRQQGLMAAWTYFSEEAAWFQQLQVCRETAPT